MYGYFNSDTTKFSYNVPPNRDTYQSTYSVKLTETHVDVIDPVCNNIKTTRTYTIQLVDTNTGLQTTCPNDLNVALSFKKFPCDNINAPFFYIHDVTIPANATGTTYSWISNQFIPCPTSCKLTYTQNFGVNNYLSEVPEYGFVNQTPGETFFIRDGDYVRFSRIIDWNLKQLDLLSAIAKKLDRKSTRLNSSH